jgi:hypothetical protein
LVAQVRPLGAISRQVHEPAAAAALLAPALENRRLRRMDAL